MTLEELIKELQTYMPQGKDCKVELIPSNTWDGVEVELVIVLNDDWKPVIMSTEV